MLKNKRFILFSMLILILLNGCTPQNTKNDLFELKGSLLGDHSAVGNIINQLQGAEHIDGFVLQTDQKPYGLILNYDLIKSEREAQGIAIYDATFLFTLIPNVDWITFDFNFIEYTVPKEDIQSLYAKN